jgi:hypothetical protein
LVLALPILLMLMALMVNFGVVACWKVRGLSTARNAVWQARWPRNAAADPRPAYWPAAGALGTAGAGNLPALDDPRVNQPVARGPFVGNFQSAALVNADLLNPTLGLVEGSATLSRPFAMLGKMGSFNLQAETFLLADCWPYGQMSWQPPGETQTYGLGSNLTPRIPVIYEYDKQQGMSAAYVQAVMAVVNAPFNNALKPLDQDDEFILYGQLFGGGGAPDFYPRLAGFCDLDRSLADEQVQDLIDRIQGKQDPHVPDVAENMTVAFINLYQRAIQAYNNLMNAQPPPPPAQVQAMQAQINQLQQKIDVLNRFLQTLQ